MAKVTWTAEMRNEREGLIVNLVLGAEKELDIMTKAKMIREVRGNRGLITKSVRRLVEGGELQEVILPRDIYDALSLIGPRPSVLFSPETNPEEFFSRFRERVLGKGSQFPEN